MVPRPNHLYVAVLAAAALAAFTFSILPTINDNVIPPVTKENLDEILGICRSCVTTSKQSKTLLSDSLPGKPYIVLHFGPAKTGTTTLQHELSLWKERILELDNVLYGGVYYVLGEEEREGRLDVQGKFMDFSFVCHRAMSNARRVWESQQPNNNNTLKEHLLRRVPCFQDIARDLASYHANGTSLIFSNEKKSVVQAWKRVYGCPLHVPLDWLSIAAALGDEWNFIFVLGHRPFLDWIPSAKAQADKYSPLKPRMRRWPGAGGSGLGSLFPHGVLVEHNETYDLFWKSILANKNQEPEYFEPTAAIRENFWKSYQIPFLHSVEIYDKVSPYIPIQVFHLHDPTPIRTNFLCNVLPNTQRSCQASMQADKHSDAQVAHMNSGKSSADHIWFDQLATTALARGMFVVGQWERKDVADKARHQHEVVWNRTLLDFPRKCPLPGALYSLWDHSWRYERKIMGDIANLTLHMDLFLRNILNAKYCAIDATRTLEQPDWKDFFERDLKK